MKQIISLVAFICLIVAIIMLVTGHNNNNVALYIGLLGLTVYGLNAMVKK